jgi:hypothetical protein
MKNHTNNSGISRRDFLATSSFAVGGLTLLPSFVTRIHNDLGLHLESAMNTKIGVKFINGGIVHEDAWEGSCRWGDLKNMTKEAEINYIENGMKQLKADLSTLHIPSEVNVLDPVSMYAYVEKGNPDIMLHDEQLDMLAHDEGKTDLYVVGSPFIGYRIAQRYRKPVCILQKAGWGVDGPGGIRHLGVDAFHATTWDELFDVTRVMFAKKAFANTRLLSITNFPDRVPYGVVSGITDLDSVQAKFGMGYEFMDYKDFFGFMDSMEKDNEMVTYADKVASELVANATSSNMTKESIARSVMFYLTTLKMMQKQKCNAFTIECFELCSSLNPWNRKFTPCLNNALMKDSGIPSACEGDINALLAMMVEMYLSGKATYMGNPDIDKDNNLLQLHHSVASLKMLGFEQQSTPYQIHSFMNAGYGTTLRHDFANHVGEAVTVGRFDPSASRMLITSGKITDGSGLEGSGCAQNVTMKIPDGRKFWKASHNYGHHLAFVYGNYVNQIEDLGGLMGFEVEVQ